MTTCIDCSMCDKECKQDIFENFRDKYQAISEFHYSPNIHSLPTNLILGLTNNCNLACPYCFVQQNSQTMTYKIAEDAIKWAIENYQKKSFPKNIPNITFFGGEPLLQFNNIIKPLVEKWHDQVTFSITTNGILLNEDIVDFFHLYNVSILLSFDGVEEVQNKQRPGKTFNSFDTILKNIPYLLIRFPYTVMRATLTKNSLPYMYESVLMAAELGFKTITFCPNAFESWGPEEEKIYSNQLEKITLYIYKQLHKNIFPIQVNPIIKVFDNINKAINSELFFNNNILRCGLGTTTCAITVDGKIIPCQEKLSHPTIILGDIYKGIDPFIHKNYLINYFNKVNNITCDRCCFDKEKLQCLSDICPSRLEDLNYKFSSSECIFTQQAYKATARLHLLCSKSNNKLWREYFNELEEEQNND